MKACDVLGARKRSSESMAMALTRRTETGGGDWLDVVGDGRMGRKLALEKPAEAGNERGHLPGCVRVDVREGCEVVQGWLRLRGLTTLMT